MLPFIVTYVPRTVRHKASMVRGANSSDESGKCCAVFDKFRKTVPCKIAI
jgi:hypothetical protein